MSVGPADPKSLQALPTWVVGPPIPPGVRIGKLLQGEYLIKGILGEGELGVTYEAENARLKRKFAVQMLKRELKPTQGMMLQVRDDLRRAEPLMHSGIMPVKMIVDHMMVPGFATELLEGETLRARCSRGPLPPERALAIVLAVARALDALHKAGAVHGDLRPENIFLVRPGAKSSFAGRVMVVEHALHPLRRRSQGLDDQLPLYKLMYRPPECLAGESVPHIGGDVFVLGAILHECLTGRPAFYDEVADFVIDNLNQPPKPIAGNPATGLTPQLAAALSVLVASACARDPAVRTPDMAEIIVAIEQVVQGAGLTLPTVVTEEPQAASTAPPTPTASRMNRLLHRLSGVFPQVPLPPLTEPVSGSPPAAAATGTGTAGGSAAVAGTGKIQATTMPPIVAPRTKVTRLLQKLSGVFPVLQVAPDGTLEELASSHPKIAGAFANPSSGALSPAPVAAGDPQPAVAPGAPPVPASPGPAVAAPSSPAAVPVPAAAPDPAPLSVAPGPEKSEPVLLDDAAKPVSASTAPAAPEAALPGPSPVAAEPASPAKGSEVAKALALLRLQQQARAAGQPADAARGGVAPATPEPVVPAFMAPQPAPPSARSPLAAQAPAGATSAAAPSSTSPRPTVPPVDVEAPAPAASPIVAAAGLLAAGLGRASEAVTPALSIAPSIFTPTVERSTSGPPPRSDIAFDSTLQPDDVADFMDAAVAAAAAADAEGPKTLSEIPTRPAALLGLEPIPRYNEAKTQPALRRMPITEQATQAKLSPELFAQATAVRGAAPDLSGQLPASAMPTSPAASTAVEVAPIPAPAAPPAAAAAATSPSARAPQLDSMPELEEVSVLAELASPPPPAPKSDKPPRPPRVSQLIKALQQGQIDQVQAMQQASGSPAREPASPAAPGRPANPPAPGPTSSAAGQATPSSGGTPSPTPTPTPTQGRVSPGLVPHAPNPPSPADSPWGTATQHVVPAPAPGVPAPTGLQGFLLRNQEVMAALIGALLVLLVGIAYLLLR